MLQRRYCGLLLLLLFLQRGPSTRTRPLGLARLILERYRVTLTDIPGSETPNACFCVRTNLKTQNWSLIQGLAAPALC